jgi:hypothetical protein
MNTQTPPSPQPSPMPDLSDILNAIRADPDDGPQWLALAACYGAHGRADEADAVRVLWPTLRDNARRGMSVDAALADVAQHAAIFGQLARQVEGQGRPEVE